MGGTVKLESAYKALPLLFRGSVNQ